MLHYKDNEYELALFNFHDAFKIIPNELTNHYFYAAASALHLGQDDKAEQLLIDAIEKTNASESQLNNLLIGYLKLSSRNELFKPGSRINNAIKSSRRCGWYS